MTPPDPLLDHLERTFADAYRKEIDQEENVWRSLPFFAATLALQLTALVQIRDWLTGAQGPLAIVAEALLSIAGAATLTGVALLAVSVWPADLAYVSDEPSLLDYAEELRAEVAAAGPEDAAPESASASALREVKLFMAEQYAAATASNRALNQRRARWRTRAGLVTLMSVGSVLVLVALGVVTKMHGHG